MHMNNTDFDSEAVRRIGNLDINDVAQTYIDLDRKK